MLSLAVAAVPLATASCTTQEPSRADLQRVRASHLEEQPLGPVSLGVKEDSLRAFIPRFYEVRDEELVWIEPNGRPGAAPRLLEALRSLGRHGLAPERYQLETLGLRLDSLPTASMADRVATDVALTHALLLAADDMLRGRVGPDELETTWQSRRRELDLPRHVAEELNPEDPEEMLTSLAPPHARYDALVDALGRYREISEQGGWGSTAPERLDDEGVEGRIALHRAVWERLSHEGYTDGRPPRASASDTLDLFRGVASAVAEFQGDRGIEPDSVLGFNTLSELNVPVEERVRTLILNLERWRWLPGELADRRVEVNIASFLLDAYEGGDPVLQMGVIVGEDDWKTPIFSDQVDHVVINPFWNVPESIALAEILPKVKEDPSFLDEMNYDVLEGWGADSVMVDPSEVDWEDLPDDSLPVRFRQAPGPGNALGRIKFMFPNEFNIYLHDTPADQLFGRTDRALSHGCVRVERPVDLADFVFSETDGWDGDRTADVIASEEHTEVPLDRPLPVHLLYWTATVDGDRVRFYQDIYGVDARLAAAILTDPGRAAAVR